MIFGRVFALVVVAAPVAWQGESVVAVTRAVAHSVQTDTVPRGFTDADTRFMQGMIIHHAQALVMADLLRTRSGSDRMHLLGERITVSQQDEIAMMRHWLEDRRQTAPFVQTKYMAHDTTGMSHDMERHMALMPGMLTSAQLTQLANANGPEFDRLFLVGMIRHHEGALTMVSALFSSKGAGQESQIFGFASDVDSEQRAEIARMHGMLKTMASTTPMRKRPK